MAQNLVSMGSGQTRVARAVATIAVAGALGGLGGQSAAQAQGSLAGESIESLERLFWICDYGSIHEPFDAGFAMECSVVWEALKARKFNGDFDSFLAWWREKKDAEHGALASAGRPGAPEMADLRRR